MNAVECKTEIDYPTMDDYARDIQELVREEGDRIRRILKVIDESMTAIHNSRKLLDKN